MPPDDPESLPKDEGVWAPLHAALGSASDWSKPLLVLVSVLTLFWGSVLFVVGKNELHLVVWVESQALLYPAEETGGRSLPLTFESTEVGSVAYLKVQISNYGSAMIGDEASLWVLELEAENAQQLAMVGELVREPEILVARALPSSGSNVIRLELGALQAGARLNLEIMALNITGNALVRLVARPSLPGLPHEIAEVAPSIRVSERLGWPIFGSFLFVFALAGLAKGCELRAELAALGGGSLLGRIALTLLVILAAALISTVFVAKGLATLVLWFA